MSRVVRRAELRAQQEQQRGVQRTRPRHLRLRRKVVFVGLLLRAVLIFREEFAELPWVPRHLVL